MHFLCHGLACNASARRFFHAHQTSSSIRFCDITARRCRGNIHVGIEIDFAAFCRFQRRDEIEYFTENVAHQLIESLRPADVSSLILGCPC